MENFGNFLSPFLSQEEHRYFQNTEILNVVGVEITYCFKNSIFNPTSLNSNKLIIHIVYYFITTMRLFMTKIFGRKFYG